MSVATIAAIVALALAAPRPGRDTESAEDRTARVTTIAIAAAEAAESDEGDAWPWDRESLAVAALAVTWHESIRWSRWVHAAPWVRDVRGTRATCLGQIHVTPWVPIAEWRTLAGVDVEPTRRCLGAVVRVLSRRRGSLSRRRRADRVRGRTRHRGVRDGQGLPQGGAALGGGRAWIWGQWTRRLVELELAAEGESDSGDATMRREIEL